MGWVGEERVEARRLVRKANAMVQVKDTRT